MSTRPQQRVRHAKAAPQSPEAPGTEDRGDGEYTREGRGCKNKEPEQLRELLAKRSQHVNTELLELREGVTDL